MKKLCSFLDVELQSDVIQDIVNLCDFSSMTEERRERFVRTGHSVNNFKFYRKGKHENILHTVNSEIFARTLFSRIALNDIFVRLKFVIRARFTYIVYQ